MTSLGSLPIMGFCVRLSSKVFYCGDFAELSRREEEALSYSALHGDDLLSKKVDGPKH